MNIPEEAIEAAAKAVGREWTADPEWIARAALEAAAPLIAAQALREAADSWKNGQHVNYWLRSRATELEPDQK